MSVFYRSPRVLITDDVFEVAYTARRRYAIRDLHDVHIVRREPQTRSAERVLGLSALVAGLLVVPVVGRVSALLSALCLVVLLVTVVLNIRRRAPITWQLAATYRGHPAILLDSDDRHEFEQVCRGLLRSLEHRDNVG